MGKLSTWKRWTIASVSRSFGSSLAIDATARSFGATAANAIDCGATAASAIASAAALPAFKCSAAESVGGWGVAPRASRSATRDADSSSVAACCLDPATHTATALADLDGPLAASCATTLLGLERGLATNTTALHGILQVMGLGPCRARVIGLATSCTRVRWRDA